VVDSLNDSDDSFSNGASVYAYLNRPFMVLIYDNGGWGIDRMNLIALHESRHIFAALDEYAFAGCSTAGRWGYLTVANASCNNGGITSDISVMGEGSEPGQSVGACPDVCARCDRVEESVGQYRRRHTHGHRYSYAL
jgi:hypothetical protein